MRQQTTITIFIVISLIIAGGLAALPRYEQVQNTKQAAPEIKGSTWLNSSPLSLQALKGKVVMVEFWTYGCYNCVNVQPYLKEWYRKYQQAGFEIIAVHSPEFAHERDVDNVQNYVTRNQIDYPVVIDNDFNIWRSYANRYWPAMYLIDKNGRIRYRHMGEGAYARTEQMIKALLAEPSAS